MTYIRRYFKPGNTCFLTHVTYQRMPILVGHFDLLWQTLESANETSRLGIIAWVVLPDHFHLVMDPFDNDLSKHMKRVKLSFSTNYRKRMGLRKGRVWQYRFWDHIIRDQVDMNRHVDYIHYNAVKHGLVTSPFQWQFSSIHSYFNKGLYQHDWGVKEPKRFEGSFGE